MFDRLRKEIPALNHFRKFTNELAIESDITDSRQQWVAMRKHSIRSGNVNPEVFADAYAAHAKVLEIAPYFLSISPLEVDYLELMYGFDLPASGNHDGIVFENREGRLPKRPRGYYREYVHPTPDLSGPGPQRVVVGESHEVYYTPDHYRSFRRIR